MVADAVLSRGAVAPNTVSRFAPFLQPSLSVANQKRIAQDPGAIDCAPQVDDVCAARTQADARFGRTVADKSSRSSHRACRPWFFGERQLISAIRTKGRSVCTVPKRPLSPGLPPVRDSRAEPSARHEMADATLIARMATGDRLAMHALCARSQDARLSLHLAPRRRCGDRRRPRQRSFSHGLATCAQVSGTCGCVDLAACDCALQGARRVAAPARRRARAGTTGRERSRCRSRSILGGQASRRDACARCLGGLPPASTARIVAHLAYALVELGARGGGCSSGCRRPAHGRNAGCSGTRARSSPPCSPLDRVSGCGRTWTARLCGLRDRAFA